MKLLTEERANEIFTKERITSTGIINKENKTK
jgi:hypothetical protein